MGIGTMEIRTRVKGRIDVNQLSLIEFKDSTFEGVDFSGKKADSFSAINCQFISCNFDKMIVKNACFGGGMEQSKYFDCSFNEAKFKASAPGNARFERCSFRRVNLEEFQCKAVEFIDCTFSGSIKKSFFNGALHPQDLIYSLRKTNDFVGNDFSQVSFKDVGFRTGIDLRKQKLPVTGNYVYIEDGEAFIQRMREKYLTEADLTLREQVFLVLKILQFATQGGQQQLFISKEDFPKSVNLGVKAILDRSLMLKA